MAGLFRRPPYIAHHHKRGPVPKGLQAVSVGLITQTAAIHTPTVAQSQLVALPLLPTPHPTTGTFYNDPFNGSALTADWEEYEFNDMPVSVAGGNLVFTHASGTFYSEIDATSARDLTGRLLSLEIAQLDDLMSIGLGAEETVGVANGPSIDVTRGGSTYTVHAASGDLSFPWEVALGSLPERLQIREQDGTWQYSYVSGGTETVFGSLVAPEDPSALFVFINSSGNVFSADGAVAAASSFSIYETSQVFGPTVTAVASVSLGLIDQTAATFAPTVISQQLVAPSLINQTAQIHDPTITTGAVAASVGLIDQTAATFTPTVTPGAVSVLLGLIDQTATIAAPSLSLTVFPNFINRTAAIHAATVSNLNTISVGLINQAATASSPTITTGAVNVALGLITQTAQIHAFSVTTGNVNVTPNLIDQTAAIHTATISTANAIVLDLIDQTAQIHSPTVATGAASISIGIIDQTAQIGTPTITTGAVSVSPNFIDQTAAASAPTITTANSISAGLISQPAVANAPSISIDVALGLISQAAQIHSPTLTTAVSVSVGLINQTATISAPTVYGTYGSAVLADGPLAWWRLGEPSGTNANDEIGNADADYVNTPTLGVTGLLNGDSNTAVTFVRASLEHAATGATGPAGGSVGVSLESWTSYSSLTAATRYPALRWWTNTPASSANLYYDVAQVALRYQYEDGTALRAISSNAWVPVTGTRYHLVVTHDYAAELVSFYANGSLISVEDVSAFGPPVNIPANSFVSLARSGSDYFDGTLDEAALYGTVLSPTRVLAHYVAGGHQAVNVGLISQPATASAPSIASSVALGLINQTASPFTPTVTAGAVAVSLELIDQTAVAFEPLMDTGGAFVFVDRIDQTAATFSPAITTGAAPLSVGLIDQTAQTFTPTVATVTAVSVDLISQPAATFDPSISTANTIAVGQINQAAAIFAPSVARGAVSVDLGLINQPAATFDPSVSATSVISVGLINQAAIAAQPAISITGDQNLDLGVIDQAAVAYGISVTGGVSTGPIRGAGRWVGWGGTQQWVPPPEDQRLTLATLRAQTRIFSPSVDVSDDEVLLGLSEEDLLVLA